MDGGFLDGYIASGAENGFFGIVRPQGYSHPEVLALEITAGGRMVDCAGVAFCLFFYEPRIKVLPKKYGDELFSVGDRVRIRLEIQ